MDRLNFVPAYIRGAAPLAVLGALFALASLHPIADAFDIKALDMPALVSILVVFALISAITERAVEVLMLMRFGPDDRVAGEKMRLLAAAEDVLLARDGHQTEQADPPKDPKGNLSTPAEVQSGEDLLQRIAALETRRQSEVRTRSFWAGICSLILSMAMALIGYRFLDQLVSVSASVSDDSTRGTVFLSLDVVVTTLLISGGAEWFHRIAMVFTPNSTRS